MKKKLLCLIIFFLLFFLLCGIANAQPTGTFTVHVSGPIVTATPTLNAHVDYYKWTTENDINSETEWISSDDTVDHKFVLNYATDYIITLYFKNETEGGKYSRHVEIGTRHATVDLEEEGAVEEPLEVSKFKNMFDDFPPRIKDWFADRNATEATVMSLGVVFLVMFLILYSRKQDYRYYILRRKKK